ncbi:MAG: hypothetical protein A2W29_10580 [Gemmatimonadetes bacterium RBG_16_66_8]|nr:MAG: hypothetical protein A2W29_10580 [Gemmatimonadetes bacterium RBG_16_66_8]
MVAAVGFLLLDAVLLALAAVWGERPALWFWAAMFAVGALGIFFVWRRYLSHLGQLDTHRRDMRFEIERMRSAVRNGPSS